MNTTIFSKAFAISSLMSISLSGAINAATTTLVDDWYAINSGASATILDGNTVSPDYQSIGLTGLDRVFSYFDPVSLGDGQTLTLSFSLTLSLADDATTKTFNNFRFGIFDASTPYATTTTFGPERTSSVSVNTTAWRGFLLRDPGSANGPMRFYRKRGNIGEGFATINDADMTQTFASTGGYTLAFSDGIARTFTLVMERSGNDLSVFGNYGTGSFSGIMTNAFLESGFSQFDVFGLYATGNDGVVIDSAMFSNVTVQVIPEPATSVLMVGSLLAFAICIRRRSRGR